MAENPKRQYFRTYEEYANYVIKNHSDHPFIRDVIEKRNLQSGQSPEARARGAYGDLTDPEDVGRLFYTEPEQSVYKERLGDRPDWAGGHKGLPVEKRYYIEQAASAGKGATGEGPSGPGAEYEEPPGEYKGVGPFLGGIAGHVSEGFEALLKPGFFQSLPPAIASMGLSAANRAAREVPSNYEEDIIARRRRPDWKRLLQHGEALTQAQSASLGLAAKDRIKELIAQGMDPDQARRQVEESVISREKISTIAEALRPREFFESALQRDAPWLPSMDPVENQAEKARELRGPFFMMEGGEPATVKMQSMETGGGREPRRYFATPTLFPKTEAPSDDPKDWLQLEPGDAAFEEAKRRGEVFEFTTAKEAEEFALGGWKPKGKGDEVGERSRRALFPGEVDWAQAGERLVEGVGRPFTPTGRKEDPSRTATDILGLLSMLPLAKAPAAGGVASKLGRLKDALGSSKVTTALAEVRKRRAEGLPEGGRPVTDILEKSVPPPEERGPVPALARLQNLLDFPLGTATEAVRAGVQMKPVKAVRDWARERGAERRAGKRPGGGFINAIINFAQPVGKQWLQKEAEYRYKPVTDGDLLTRKDPAMQTRLNRAMAKKQEGGPYKQARFIDVFKVARDLSAPNIKEMITEGLFNVMNLSRKKLSDQFEAAKKVILGANVTVPIDPVRSRISMALDNFYEITTQPEMAPVQQGAISRLLGRKPKMEQVGEKTVVGAKGEVQLPTGFSEVGRIVERLLNAGPAMKAEELWTYRGLIDDAMDNLSWENRQSRAMGSLNDVREIITMHLSDRVPGFKKMMDDYARDRQMLDDAFSQFNISPGQIKAVDAGAKATESRGPLQSGASAPSMGEGKDAVKWSEVRSSEKGAGYVDEAVAERALEGFARLAQDGVGFGKWDLWQRMVNYVEAGDSVLPLWMGFVTDEWFAKNLIAKQQTAQTARQVVSQFDPYRAGGMAASGAGASWIVSEAGAGIWSLLAFIPAFLLFSPKGASKIKTALAETRSGRRKGISEERWITDITDSERLALRLQKEYAKLDAKTKEKMRLETLVRGMTMASFLGRAMEEQPGVGKEWRTKETVLKILTGLTEGQERLEEAAGPDTGLQAAKTDQLISSGEQQ